MKDDVLMVSLHDGFSHVGRMPERDYYVKDGEPWEDMLHEEELVRKRRSNNELVLSKPKATELDDTIFEMKNEEAAKWWQTTPRPLEKEELEKFNLTRTIGVLE